MTVSERVKAISQSPTLSLNAKVKRMKADGEDVLNFTAGEPDFDTPDNIKDAAIDAIRSGFTKYTASSGTPELRSRICGKLKRENGLSYKPDEIIVSCGGKHVLYNIMVALCNPGDEVIIPKPYWVSYPEQVRLVGGKPVFTDTSKENGFRLRAKDVEKAVTKKTRALILNSPNNPSGAVCGRKELEDIAKMAVDNDFYVISDEIYEHLVYDGRHVSIAGLGKGIRERTITVNGAAKAYAMTGWRIGWAAGPEDVIKAMGKFQSHTTSNPSSISQAAYAEAITGSQDSVKRMREEFRRRRDIMVKGLNGIDGIECGVPDGSFYVFPDVSGCFRSGMKDSLSFSERLIDKAKVATVPGVAFGVEGHLRMSYACSEENIRKGLERIVDFVRGI